MKIYECFIYIWHKNRKNFIFKNTNKKLLGIENFSIFQLFLLQSFHFFTKHKILLKKNKRKKLKKKSCASFKIFFNKNRKK